MSIRIEEQGRPIPLAVETKPEVDLQDAFMVAGVILAESGAWWIWRPAALILAAMFCFFFALLIERAKSRKNNGNH